MLFLWSLIVSTVLLVVYLWPAIRRFKQRYDCAKTLPGPSVLEFLAAKRKGRIMEFVADCRQKYGPVFKIWLGLELNVTFCDPDDVKTIVKSNVLIDKANTYSYFEAWLGKGLLTNGGENWHMKRKLLTPAFHFQILSTFKEPMEECCEILVDRLSEVADGQPVNIYKYVTLFALDVICETAMGIKVNAQLNEESEFVKATQLTCRLVQDQIFSAWKQIGFLYKWSADKKERDVALKVLHGETRRVIKMRREQLEAETNQTLDGNFDSEESFMGKKKRRAFLDSLLIAQRETGLLTDANIQEEVDTFMFEGHDTTSSAIAFTLFMLSKNPEVQRKLFEEISNSGDKDSLLSLPYLEAVIKEALRLFPSVPSFSRQTREPFTVGQYTIPPFVTMTVNAFRVHREPTHFPDPESFRPERFLKNAAPHHPFAHVAFSAGPRNCIGSRFAMLELKCSVSRLVEAFEFTAVPDFELHLVHKLVLKSRTGVMVRLHKRNCL